MAAFVLCNIPLGGVCQGYLRVSHSAQLRLTKAKMEFIQSTWRSLQSQRRNQAPERVETKTALQSKDYWVGFWVTLFLHRL